MTLVVDASTVVTALIGGGAHGKWAKAKLRNGGHLVAPAVMTIEATNALRRLEARGRLDPSAASTYFADLQRLRVEVVPFDLIADRIWELRGNVTSDVLHKLVDNATQQMRLMALAESANDTTANVDEPSQHIVMETSENGSTIISDGTGQFPQLDPQKVSASVNVGSRSVDVLVLTQDQEFLETIKDSSGQRQNSK